MYIYTYYFCITYSGLSVFNTELNR